MSATASRNLLVTMIVSCAGFMQMLDSTIIATALPQMSVSFHTSPIALNVGITAYILTAAVFMPTSGWLADRFGTATVFRGAIIVFTIGSILCAMSVNLWEFTTFRVIQGLGGAIMMPVGQLVALGRAEKGHVIRNMNLITAPGLIAPIIGPPLGGFITTYASWHWIFLLNIPIGIIGIVLVSIYVENHRAAERRPGDLVGFLLTGAALVLLMYALELFGRRPIAFPAALGLLAAGLAMAVVAVRYALRKTHPMLNLSPFRTWTFAASARGGVLFRGMIGAWSFLMPLMLQVGFGKSAFESGLLILGNAIGDLLMKGFTRQILRRFGFRAILIYNGLWTSLLIAAYALLTAATPEPAVVALLFVSGSFRSLQFTALNTLNYADIPPAGMSAATTMASLLQQLAIGGGVAVAAILLQVGLVLRQAPLDATLSTPDFHVAFAALGAVALVSALLFLDLDPRAGAEVSQHKRSLALAREARAEEGAAAE